MCRTSYLYSNLSQNVSLGFLMEWNKAAEGKSLVFGRLIQLKALGWMIGERSHVW